MNVWYTVASKDRDQTIECLAAWRARGYKTAALFVLGMETVVEADLTFYVSDFQSTYDGLNIAASLLVAQHAADVVVTGTTAARPDAKADPAQVAADAFQKIPDGCFVVRPAAGPLWLGRGWVDQAYRGHGPFWPEYTAAWGEMEVVLIASRLSRLVERADVKQTNTITHDDADAGLFRSRLTAAFPESSLWEP